MEGNLFFKANYKEEYKTLEAKRSDWWTAIKPFSMVEGSAVDFKDIEFLNRLRREPNFREKVLLVIVEETAMYIKVNKVKVEEFLDEV